MEIWHAVMLVRTGTILVAGRFQHKCLLIQLCSGFVLIVFNQSGVLCGLVQSCVSCCHHEICVRLDVIRGEGRQHIIIMQVLFCTST